MESTSLLLLYPVKSSYSCCSPSRAHEAEAFGILLPHPYDRYSPFFCVINLFYPASYLPHKRHSILFTDALLEYCSIHSIFIHLTVAQSELSGRHASCSVMSSKNLIFLGRISHSEVLRTLSTADALLFLSKVESLGLPLLEAQQLNIPIIAPSCDYSHELLGQSFYSFKDDSFDISPIDLISAINTFLVEPCRPPRLRFPTCSISHLAELLESL